MDLFFAVKSCEHVLVNSVERNTRVIMIWGMDFWVQENERIDIRDK